MISLFFYVFRSNKFLFFFLGKFKNLNKIHFENLPQPYSTNFQILTQHTNAPKVCITTTFAQKLMVPLQNKLVTTIITLFRGHFC